MEPFADKKVDIFFSSLAASDKGISYISKDHWILGIKRCCMMHSFCVPLKEEPSMIILRADDSLASSSSIHFLSVNEPPIISPKNFSG